MPFLRRWESQSDFLRLTSEKIELTSEKSAFTSEKKDDDV